MLIPATSSIHTPSLHAQAELEPEVLGGRLCSWSRSGEVATVETLPLWRNSHSRRAALGKPKEATPGSCSGKPGLGIHRVQTEPKSDDLGGLSRPQAQNVGPEGRVAVHLKLLLRDPAGVCTGTQCSFQYFWVSHMFGLRVHFLIQ